MGVNPKIGKKMDGLFHVKAYEQMDDLGGKNPYLVGGFNPFEKY